MNKVFIFIGIILASFLLFKINSGEILANDVVRIINGGTEVDQGKRLLSSKKESMEKAKKKEREAEKIPEVKDRDISILAFGDMMLGRHVRVLMDQYGKGYIFEDLYHGEGYGGEGGFFTEADIVFANLEGPISGAGKKGGTSMNFAFNEDVAPFLKEYGFNLLSITNNHSLDQGWDGRDSTIAALDSSGIGWCGHPTKSDPSSVYYGEIDDESYAFVCFQDVSSRLNQKNALDLIEWVDKKVDYLIVSVHWGYEYKHYPDYELQVFPGRNFVDAGADLVIGHHPHVVQGFEEYNGRLIFYSLGNFVFDQYWSQMTQDELAIYVILDDSDENEGENEGENGEFHTKVYFYPMKSIYSKSRLLTEKEYDSWVENFIEYGDHNDETKAQIREGFVEVGM